MTRYLIPCGISILDGVERGRGEPTPPVERRGALVKDLKSAAARLGVAAGRDAWLDLLGGWDRDLRLLRWAPTVCAEAATVAVRKDAPAMRPDMSGDLVVLLASDTPEGLLSAFLVAAWMAGGDRERIRYAETPAFEAITPSGPPRGEYPAKRGDVLVVRLAGLSAARRDGFRNAAYGLGDVIRHVRDRAGGDAIEVHFSGGYKAALLHTLSLTEILYSTMAYPRPVTAWYLYEEDPSDVNASPVGATRIGLRRFSEPTCKAMAQEVAIARRDPAKLRAEEEDRLLAGVILTDEPGTAPELNAFGYGFLALLPPVAPVNPEGNPRGG